MIPLLNVLFVKKKKIYLEYLFFRHDSSRDSTGKKICYWLLLFCQRPSFSSSDFVSFCAALSEKAMAPHSSTLAWKIHGRRSLVGCSPWGRKESDTTERLPFHFSLSCIGEGNGNPLQCSCLENPRGRGAWWAAAYGVAQSRTRLKRLSSSSSTALCYFLQTASSFT